MNGSFEWKVVKNGNLQTAGALESIQRIAKTNCGFTVTTQEGILESSYLILKPTQGFATLRLISEPMGYRHSGNTRERYISIGTPVTGTSLWKPI